MIIYKISQIDNKKQSLIMVITHLLPAFVLNDAMFLYENKIRRSVGYGKLMVTWS